MQRHPDAKAASPSNDTIRDRCASIHDDILAFINANKEAGYQAFQAKLIPNLEPATIAGVRTPALRRFAKELAQRPDVEEFLSDTPHAWFEQNQLHAFVIATQKDPAELARRIDAFLPYVDNWATCDQLSPAGLARDEEILRDCVNHWLNSDHAYTIRFGIGVVLRLFLDERFEPGWLERIAEIESNEYYVNMMCAWLFAEAFAKQPNAALAMIESNRLDRWTHNKAIQKAIESHRVDASLKEHLRTLRRT